MTRALYAPSATLEVEPAFVDTMSGFGTWYARQALLPPADYSKYEFFFEADLPWNDAVGKGIFGLQLLHGLD